MATGAVTEAVPWVLLAVLGAVLVPVSSFFGVRGWHEGFAWIWQISIVADMVFTLGTVTAFALSVAVGLRTSSRLVGPVATAGTGLLMHWLVYEVSWRLVLSVASDETILGLDSIGFVAWVGYAGLMVSAAAAAVTTMVLQSVPTDVAAGRG